MQPNSVFEKCLDVLYSCKTKQQLSCADKFVALAYVGGHISTRTYEDFVDISIMVYKNVC